MDREGGGWVDGEVGTYVVSGWQRKTENVWSMQLANPTRSFKSTQVLLCLQNFKGTGNRPQMQNSFSFL